MADKVTARHETSKFAPHPEVLSAAAVCADVIDLGEYVQRFQDNDPYIVHKVVIVFLTGERNAETGVLHDVSPEFTVSMSDRSNLRKFLSSWRGKPYTTEEAANGVPLDKLEGAACLLSVSHKKSAKERVYAVVSSIGPLPKQMAAAKPDITGYTRADYWAEKKKQYATDVAAFKKANQQSAATENEFEDFPQDTGDDDDSLPF